MNNIITSIKAGIIAVATLVSSIFGATPAVIHTLPPVLDQASELSLGAYGITGGGTYRLKASVGSTDVTISLASFKEPVSTTPYTMTYLNTTIGYGTIDPQTTRPEFVSFTGITQNSDGSASLTGVTRGLTRTPQGNACTASSTLAVRHPGQSIFILSDSPCHFAEYTAKKNDETITGSWSFPTPVAANNAATKTYVDNLVNGGTVSTDKIVTAATAGETVSSGQVLYYNIYEAEWRKADADVASTSAGVILGISQGAGTDGVAINGGVLLHGIDSHQGTSLTPGSTFYLSGTSGATTTSIGTVNKRLGVVKDVDEFYFDPFFGNPQLSLANTWTATSTHQANLISTAFGGTGADGALTVTSGATNIDLGNSAFVVKNYTNLSITGTGSLTFTNPNASGTVIMLKSQGDCAITSSTNPAIDVRGIGATAGAGVASATGTAGTIGIMLPLVTTNPGAGGGGTCSAAGSVCTPGGGGGSAGSVVAPTVVATSSLMATKVFPLIVGSAGGAGGGGSNSQAGGNGGRGGGALVMQCGGSLNFTSTVSAAGSAGSATSGAGINDWGGGGGGGGGGTFWMFYNYLTSNLGTITVSGGAGADDGGGGGDECQGVNQCGGGGGGGGSNTAGTAGTAGTTSDGGNGGTGGNGIGGVFQNVNF